MTSEDLEVTSVMSTCLIKDKSQRRGRWPESWGEHIETRKSVPAKQGNSNVLRWTIWSILKDGHINYSVFFAATMRRDTPCPHKAESTRANLIAPSLTDSSSDSTDTTRASSRPHKCGETIDNAGRSAIPID